MRVEPYLFFEGRCEEAIAFYRQALGAQLTMLMRYKDSPEPPPPDTVTPGSGSKVMHAALRIGDTNVMVSDGRCDGVPAFHGFALSLAASSVAEADRMYTALADGGQVQMPLGSTFFSPCFGMVTDCFGVSWMIIVPADQP